MLTFGCKNSKVIPVTGSGGPYGCETPWFQNLTHNWLTDGTEVISLMLRPRFAA
jgi:hypothetical protein